MMIFQALLTLTYLQNSLVNCIPDAVPKPSSVASPDSEPSPGPGSNTGQLISMSRLRSLGDAISNIDNTEEKESDESIIGDKYSTKKIKNFDFLLEKLQNRDHSLKGVNFLNENEAAGKDNSQNTHRTQVSQADLLSVLSSGGGSVEVKQKEGGPEIRVVQQGDDIQVFVDDIPRRVGEIYVKKKGSFDFSKLPDPGNGIKISEPFRDGDREFQKQETDDIRHVGWNEKKEIRFGSVEDILELLDNVPLELERERRQGRQNPALAVNQNQGSPDGCTTTGYDTRTRDDCQEVFDTVCTTVQVTKYRTEIDQQCKTKIDQQCRPVETSVPKQECQERLEKRCETDYELVDEETYTEECHESVKHVCEKHIEVPVKVPVRVPVPVKVPYPEYVYSTPAEPYQAPPKHKNKNYVPTPTPGPFYSTTPYSSPTTPFPPHSNPHARNLPEQTDHLYNQHLNPVPAVPNHPTPTLSYKHSTTPSPSDYYHTTPLPTYLHHSTPSPPHPSTVKSLPKSRLDSHRSSLVHRFNSQLKREITFDHFDATPVDQDEDKKSRKKREGDPNSSPDPESEPEPQFSNVLPHSLANNNRGAFSNTLSGSVGGLFGLSSNRGGPQSTSFTNLISEIQTPLSGLSDTESEHVLGGIIDLEGIPTRVLGEPFISTLNAGEPNNENLRQAVIELLSRDPQLVAALNNLNLDANSAAVTPAGTFRSSVLFPSPTTPLPSLHQHHEPLGGVLHGGKLYQHDPRTILADVTGHHIHQLSPVLPDHHLLPMSTNQPGTNQYLSKQHDYSHSHGDQHHHEHPHVHHDKPQYKPSSKLLLLEHSGGHKEHSVTHHELPAPPGCRSVVTKKCRKVPAIKQKKVPVNRCREVPAVDCFFVLKKIPDIECSPSSYQDCNDIVKEVPYLAPEEQCEEVPYEECVEIEEQVPILVCTQVDNQRETITTNVGNRYRNEGSSRGAGTGRSRGAGKSGGGGGSRAGGSSRGRGSAGRREGRSSVLEDDLETEEKIDNLDQLRAVYLDGKTEYLREERNNKEDEEGDKKLISFPN